MKFGKVTDLKNIDFTLPEDASGTTHILSAQAPAHCPQIYVGCPVWSNKNWVGILYPKRTPTSEYLTHYAKQFNTIELNSTHYSIPNADTVSKWKNQATKGFKFCPKIPQEISHKLMPVGKAADFTQFFSQAMLALGEYLGMTFMQLSPYFTPVHFPYLASYLAEFPKEVPLSIEFRHADWFKPQVFEKAAQLLESHQMATVLTDVAGRRDILHMRLTTPELVLRFVGNNLHPTDYTRADTWVERIAQWINQGLQTAYIFIHEPDENKGTLELASYFIEAFNKACNLNLHKPRIYKPPVQGSLF